MNGDYRDAALELMLGAYDLHTHSSPSHFERALDDAQLVRSYDSLGFAGVMIKNHSECTAGRAALINSAFSFDTRAYGGLVLGLATGGINTYAAESALRLGASIIWLPTRDAHNIRSNGGSAGDYLSGEGYKVTDERGALIPEVFELFDVVKSFGATLATGHLSPAESVLLCEAGIEAGVTMLLTHPDWPRTRMDTDAQAALARRGVIIEKCWNNVTPEFNLAATLVSIKKIGCEHCILTTDRGQKGRELPHEAMLMFTEGLLALGCDKKNLSLMLRENPKRIIPH